MNTITDVVRNQNRLEMLKALQLKIASTIDSTNSGRDIASLSKQLREISEEIETLEQLQRTDEISDILENYTHKQVRT